MAEYIKTEALNEGLKWEEGGLKIDPPASFYTFKSTGGSED